MGLCAIICQSSSFVLFYEALSVKNNSAFIQPCEIKCQDVCVAGLSEMLLIYNEHQMTQRLLFWQVFLCEVHCGSNFNLSQNIQLERIQSLELSEHALIVISVFRAISRNPTSRNGALKWKYAEPLGFAVVPLTMSTFPCVRHNAFAYLTEQRVKHCLLPAIKMDGTVGFFCGKTCVLVCEVSWWLWLPTYQTII